MQNILVIILFLFNKFPTFSIFYPKNHHHFSTLLNKKEKRFCSMSISKWFIENTYTSYNCINVHSFLGAFKMIHAPLPHKFMMKFLENRSLLTSFCCCVSLLVYMSSISLSNPPAVIGPPPFPPTPLPHHVPLLCILSQPSIYALEVS